ncbi:helix-turn-helix domain-containing protein [Micromonospora craniellae]|uniref:Helix-turn-helix domain-containing protein n=2 Tax=Micromonospora craniellae TaxID=2294034 RepID=A0A372FSJ1_9ACTN|nr:helix-turn-helix domain-containing protein [Micromonospora craniellae]RFS43490.1 helix-turn-helix domain-containing protein [Micromonospora craniellae]
MHTHCVTRRDLRECCRDNRRPREDHVAGKRRHRLAQRRKAIGLSQECLAVSLGVDRSTVVRWERADTDPQPWHRPRLAAALRLSIEDLADLLADVGQPPDPPDERLAYVLRHPRRVDLVAVAHLRERVGVLDQQYDRLPSTRLLAEAGQLHGQAIFLRQHASAGAVHRELTAAVAESATLMGQLVWDASQRRDHKASAAYFDQAISAAREIRDVVTEANALLRKSYLSLYGTKQPTSSLVLTTNAATVSSNDSHVIAGLAHLHRAEAHAMLGQSRACSDALVTAEEHIDAVNADDPAAALFCPSHFTRLVDSCWLFLNKPAEAISALENARHLIANRSKSTAVVLGNLALASILQRDIDAATTYLHEAIDVIERTRAGGGLNLTFGAARQLRPWRDQPGVQDVNDRLLTLMSQ